MNGVKALNLNYFFNRLAQSMVGLFVPIFLFEFWGFEGMVKYFVVARIGVFFLAPVVERVIDSWGIRWAMTIGTMFLVWQYYLLSQETNVSIWLSTLARGGFIAFYWIAHHVLFAEDDDNHRRGGQVAGKRIVAIVGGILGPILGGVVGTIWGFEALFWVGVGVALLSIGPLFLMSHHKHHHPDGVMRILKRVFKINWLKLNLSWALRGMGSNAPLVVFWPVMVAIIAGGNLEKVGGIYSLVGVGSLLIVWLAGKGFGRFGRSMRNWSGAVIAVLWLVRIKVGTWWQVLIVDSGQALAGGPFWVGVLGKDYELSEKNDPVAFMTLREMMYSVGQLIVLSLALVIGAQWNVFWVIAAISIFLVGRL
jgi:MFS family permease